MVKKKFKKKIKSPLWYSVDGEKKKKKNLPAANINFDLPIDFDFDSEFPLTILGPLVFCFPAGSNERFNPDIPCSKNNESLTLFTLPSNTSDD